jgi:hypothetical protein
VTSPGRFFTDLASGAECELVIPLGGRVYPRDGEPQIGVAHPECAELADLAVELDAFYCRFCQWNGRISGAWAAGLISGVP